MADRLGLKQSPAPGTPERHFSLDLTGKGELFDCAIHIRCELCVIEFEPHARTDFADHISMIIPGLA